MLYVLSLYDWIIYALNAQDGQPLWSYSTGETTSASPIVVDGVLYSARWPDSIDALNASNGRLLGHYAVQSNNELLGVMSIAVEP
jgi:outer membrane protein assembly factor BamB